MEGGACAGVTVGIKQKIYDLQDLRKDDQVINGYCWQCVFGM